MNIKSQYLLQAGLETLHFETKEWIEEVRFYNDEMTILTHLVNLKISHNNLEDQIHKDMELNLGSMLGRLSNHFLKDLVAHETYLSRMMQSDSVESVVVYREKHKEMVLDMERLKKDIIGLKQMIFRFMEQKEFGMRHNFLT